MNGNDQMTLSPQSYVVGGIRLPRPFKIRRLGHVGLNVNDTAASLKFYEGSLGLKIADPIDMHFVLPEGFPADERAILGSSMGYFMRIGTDHHAFVLFPRRILDTGRPPPEKWKNVTTNQITWQVGTLKEVVDAIDYLKTKQIEIRRSGRDLPGSNWHVYPCDFDGHLNELYYGMEQIGWDGFSKPASMHKARFTQAPTLPHRSESAEVNEGYLSGVDASTGYRHQDPRPDQFDVGGVLLPRPFRIVRLGPVRLFVSNLDSAVLFYQNIMGLSITEERTWNGHRCVFLRANTEHHSIALYPLSLRQELGLSSNTTLLSIGFQVGDYQQLKDAISHLQSEGIEIKFLPPELSPGIDYSAFAIDPDGHAIQLYYYMEQIGWDGKPSPPSSTSHGGTWPETVDAKPDTFGGEVFLGPLG